MNRSSLKASILVAGFVVAWGCGGSDGGGPSVTPTAEGTWVAQTLTPPPANAPRTITLTLHEMGQAVSGSCDIADGSGTLYWSGTVSGTHSHPTVSLQITAPGFEAVLFSGSFNGSDQIVATLNGSGWVNTQATFGRQ